MSSIFHSIKHFINSYFNKNASDKQLDLENEFIQQFESAEYDDNWVEIKKQTKSQLNEVFDFSKIQNNLYGNEQTHHHTKRFQSQIEPAKSQSSISEDLIILAPFLAVAEPLISFANFMKLQLKQKYEFQVLEKVSSIEQSVEILQEVIEEFINELIHVGLKNLRKHFLRCSQELKLNDYYSEAQEVFNIQAIIEKLEVYAQRLLKQGEKKDLILYNEHKRTLSFLYFRKPPSERTIPFQENPVNNQNNLPFRYVDNEENEDDQYNDIFSFNSFSIIQDNKYTIKSSKKNFLELIYIFTGDIFESKFFTEKFFEKKIEVKETSFIESKYQPSLHSITEIQEEDYIMESAKKKKKPLFKSINIKNTDDFQFSDQDSDECNNNNSDRSSLDLAFQQNSTAGSSQIVNPTKTIQLMQMIQQIHTTIPAQNNQQSIQKTCSADCFSSHSSSRYQVEKDEHMHHKKAQFSQFLRKMCQEIVEMFHSLNFQNYLFYQSNLNFIKIKNRLRLICDSNQSINNQLEDNCTLLNKQMLTQLSKIAVNLFLDENSRMKQRAQYDYYMQSQDNNELKQSDCDTQQNLFKKSLILDECLKTQLINKTFNDIAYIFFEKDKKCYEPWQQQSDEFNCYSTI